MPCYSIPQFHIDLAYILTIVPCNTLWIGLNGPKSVRGILECTVFRLICMTFSMNLVVIGFLKSRHDTSIWKTLDQIFTVCASLCIRNNFNLALYSKCLGRAFSNNLI